MGLEREYQDIDFSQFSSVKSTLLQKLHQVRKQNNNFVVLNKVNSAKQELSLDELDYAVAAKGNMYKHDQKDDI